MLMVVDVNIQKYIQDLLKHTVDFTVLWGKFYSVLVTVTTTTVSLSCTFKVHLTVLEYEATNEEIILVQLINHNFIILHQKHGLQ